MGRYYTGRLYSSFTKKASEITISKIYQNDLFGTYQYEAGVQGGPEYIIPLPPPPVPRQVRIPPEPTPQFLDPLKVTLKGIIVVLNDDSKNRAIISDTRTKKEDVYKVGDVIDDAQLIKIFGKKIVFLRSNGQQEVLYLRPKDAQMDPVYAAGAGFKDIAQEITEHAYLISPKEFKRRVKSLAQFIDLLDLTTVYKQGKSIGCRIGNIEPDSLGFELGFKPGDVILTVDNIPATDSQHRFAIYKKIVDMQTKQNIIVELLRNNQEITLTFTLEDFRPQKLGPEEAAPAEGGGKAPEVPREVQRERLQMLQERHKFAPTLQEIRNQERENMLKRGRSPRNKLTSKFAE